MAVNFQKISDVIGKAGQITNTAFNTATNITNVANAMKNGGTTKKTTNTSNYVAPTGLPPTIIYQQPATGGTGVTVAMADSTKKMLIYGGIAVVGLIAVTMILKKR